MPYITSPFTTDLLTNFTKADNIVAAGAADITGAAGAVHAMHIINSDGAVRYMNLFDSRTITPGSADIIIPIPAGSNMLVFIDEGVAFGTAISISASTARDNTGDPSNLDANIMSHDGASHSD